MLVASFSFAVPLNRTHSHTFSTFPRLNGDLEAASPRSVALFLHRGAICPILLRGSSGDPDTGNAVPPGARLGLLPFGSKRDELGPTLLRVLAELRKRQVRNSFFHGTSV